MQFYVNLYIRHNLATLSHEQLYEIGDYYYSKNLYDSALIYFNQFINAPIKLTEFELQKKKVEAINKSAVIYFNIYDYRTSYDLLIKALLLSEKINYHSYQLKIYANIGNIYSRFNKFDVAKSYYSKALNLCTDSAIEVALLTNMGGIEADDSAFHYLNKSLQISKQYNNIYIQGIYNNFARWYHAKNQKDSAYYYYQLSLKESIIQNDTLGEATALSNLGNLFLGNLNKDEASLYINQSNKIATEKNYLRLMTENYLALSIIEESKGNIKKAYEYFKKYSNLQDSIVNFRVLGDINHIQRQYEISKTNQQIEELIVEKQVKEHTIQYQKNILSIIITVSLLMGIVLYVIFMQNKKLRKAYNLLVDKNVEIIELYKKTSKIVPEITPENVNLQIPEPQNIEPDFEINAEQTIESESLSPKPDTAESNIKKTKTIVLSEQFQKDLLNRILSFMENTSEICNNDFTMNKLADLIHTNHAYVSHVINNVLKKNFCSFLNEYRIREAQRLFSEPDTSNYTIEFIAHKVGYKSRNSFCDAFKEITGVTPSFYTKSMHDKQNI